MRLTHRRQLLAALGASVAALAGCSALGQHVTAASATAQPSVSGGATAARAPARAPATAQPPGSDLLAVTLSRGRHLAIVDLESGAFTRVEAGAAPHGLALHPDGRAFLAT